MITISIIEDFIQTINKKLHINNMAHISFLNAQSLEAHDESRMVTMYINFKPYNKLYDENYYEDFISTLDIFFADLATLISEYLHRISPNRVIEENHDKTIYQSTVYANIPEKKVPVGIYTQLLGDESIMISFMKSPF